MKTVTVVVKEVNIKSVVVEIPDDVDMNDHVSSILYSEDLEWEMEEWDKEVLEIIEGDE